MGERVDYKETRGLCGLMGIFYSLIVVIYIQLHIFAKLNTLQRMNITAGKLYLKNNDDIHKTPLVVSICPRN